jgi:hypothetical protein
MFIAAFPEMRTVENHRTTRQRAGQCPNLTWRPCRDVRSGQCRVGTPRKVNAAQAAPGLTCWGEEATHSLPAPNDETSCGPAAHLSPHKGPLELSTFVAGQELSQATACRLAPGEDLLDEVVGGDRPEERGDASGHVVPVETGQMDSVHVREAGELGQPTPRRRARPDLGGPIGGDEHDRRGDQVPGEELEQVPGDRVGPVEVLDADRDHPVGGEVADDLENGDEQAAWPPLRAGCGVGRRIEPASQRRKLV